MELKLTSKNFKNGFLIDDEWMAGVNEEPKGFSSFILNHHSGEYLSYTLFESVDAAIQALNQIPRNWVYESTSGCGGDRCAEGQCKGSGCKIYSPQKAERLMTSRADREV
jgi:hypothetical protein